MWQTCNGAKQSTCGGGTVKLKTRKQGMSADAVYIQFLALCSEQVTQTKNKNIPLDTKKLQLLTLLIMISVPSKILVSA